MQHGRKAYAGRDIMDEEEGRTFQDGVVTRYRSLGEYLKKERRSFGTTSEQD